MVVRTLNYIRRNYTRKIRLSEIARDMAMSESQLNARFKRECGETVMQHLEGYRILIAKKLLSQTESTIEQIASHLAFCDQFHFSKTFKKQAGVPPLQYRRTAGHT
jgi:AraC-like DNA-binding protein